MDYGGPMDVVVHIHGGAFTGGQGIDFGPQYLLDDNDFVYVTMNYRLGVLGFASTGDSVVPGNNGLKDQVAALKWIQRNVGAFGGDSAAVTITGMSAGASSVHYHMLSPMSRGNVQVVYDRTPRRFTVFLFFFFFFNSGRIPRLDNLSDVTDVSLQCRLYTEACSTGLESKPCAHLNTARFVVPVTILDDYKYIYFFF